MGLVIEPPEHLVQAGHSLLNVEAGSKEGENEEATQEPPPMRKRRTRVLVPKGIQAWFMKWHAHMEQAHSFTMQLSLRIRHKSRHTEILAGLILQFTWMIFLQWDLDKSYNHCSCNYYTFGREAIPIFFGREPGDVRYTSFSRT